MNVEDGEEEGSATSSVGVQYEKTYPTTNRGFLHTTVEQEKKHNNKIGRYSKNDTRLTTTNKCVSKKKKHRKRTKRTKVTGISNSIASMDQGKAGKTRKN